MRNSRDDNPLPSVIPAGRSARPNVLLIVLDTVRADHLSCYGYARETHTEPHLLLPPVPRKYENVMSAGGFTAFPPMPASSPGLPATRPRSRLRASVPSIGNPPPSPNGCKRPATRQRPGRATAFMPGHAAVCIVAFSRSRHRGMRPPCTGSWGTGSHRQYQPSQPFFLFLNYMEAHRPYCMLPRRSWRWTTDEAWQNQVVGDPCRYFLASLELDGQRHAARPRGAGG